MKTLNLTSLAAGALLFATTATASSHREAPLISNDPLADNTDVYAFRCPDDPNSVMLIANYVPMQFAQGGPNYYSFGQDIRYEIHIDNNIDTPGDDIIYRVTFSRVDQDPTTFFDIRLGLENGKTTYTLERSIDGGETFQNIKTEGIVPPPNIGPRSISDPVVGLNSTYATLMSNAFHSTSTGETVFCGTVEDPFFVDLAGVFDLGDLPRQSGMPKDGLACLNVSTIAIKVPISTLQKDGMGAVSYTHLIDAERLRLRHQRQERRIFQAAHAHGDHFLFFRSGRNEALFRGTFNEEQMLLRQHLHEVLIGGIGG